MTGLIDIGTLTTTLHDESRARIAGSLGNFKSDQADGIDMALPLPEPENHGIPLWDVLQNRRAVRTYTRESIGLKSLSAMLKAAIEGDATDWPSAEYAAKVELLVVAWRVEGLPQGIYRYLPASHSVAAIGPAPNQETSGKDLVLQTEFADAPAIVLVTGDLGAALTQHGAWGHRNLLVRAGAAGYRLWLASLATGLSGTVFAGLLPRAAQRIAGLDGYRKAGLFAYAVGYAADS
ncbi:MAG TPA: nitroreductase family protein [Bryobacteraceae bacterium]|jgi:hypothetical protein